MATVNLQGYVRCPKCDYGYLLPISKVIHDHDGGNLSSATATFHCWCCSDCDYLVNEEKKTKNIEQLKGRTKKEITNDFKKKYNIDSKEWIKMIDYLKK